MGKWTDEQIAEAFAVGGRLGEDHAGMIQLLRLCRERMSPYIGESSNAALLRNRIDRLLNRTPTDQDEAIALVRAERIKQDIAFGDQRQLPPLKWNAILGEEVGEVAKALNDHEDPDAMIAELTQVAAVAVGWIEAIKAGRA